MHFFNETCGFVARWKDEFFDAAKVVRGVEAYFLAGSCIGACWRFEVGGKHRHLAVEGLIHNVIQIICDFIEAVKVFLNILISNTFFFRSQEKVLTFLALAFKFLDLWLRLSLRRLCGLLRKLDGFIHKAILLRRPKFYKLCLHLLLIRLLFLLHRLLFFDSLLFFHGLLDITKSLLENLFFLAFKPIFQNGVFS